METCIVTGSNGLVGRELVSLLLECGYRVRAWQRAPLSLTHERLEAIPFSLGEGAPSTLERACAGADALVHCAWDFNPFSWRDIERVNVQGSIALFEAAARAGLGKLVFVSSVSAYTGCESHYGRSKLAVEEAVQRVGGVSVRPGIVHGDPTAGVFGRLWKSTNAGWVPLVDGGRQKMLLVHKHDLAITIEKMLTDYERWRRRIVVVGHPDTVTLRALLERMAQARRREVRFVTVPGRWLYTALRAVEFFGLRMQFRSDSLRTLLGPDPVVDRAVIDEIGVRFRSIDEALGERNPA